MLAEHVACGEWRRDRARVVCECGVELWKGDMRIPPTRRGREVFAEAMDGLHESLDSTKAALAGLDPRPPF